jgi:hypothetical protein
LGTLQITDRADPLKANTSGDPEICLNESGNGFGEGTFKTICKGLFRIKGDAHLTADVASSGLFPVESMTEGVTPMEWIQSEVST